jgi:inorganic pyrophosphatase
MAAARLVLVAACLPAAIAAQPDPGPPATLPVRATTALAASLDAAAAHAAHVWRDTAPWAGDHVVAYVEIGRGDRRKWEFDMRANAPALDRIIPGDLGGYPINYGFVPQTVSYDGDPFDALVLGPALATGTIVAGTIVGLLYMDDEKGYDAKVVLAPAAADGARYPLTDAIRTTVATYFREYKRGQAGAFSRVPGWGGVEAGRAHVARTHAFFLDCRGRAGRPCRPPAS